MYFVLGNFVTNTKEHPDEHFILGGESHENVIFQCDIRIGR